MCTTYNRIMYICNVLRKQIHSVTYFSTQSYVFYLKPMSINTKIMLKEEFIKLVGFSVTDEEYLGIEAEYNKSGIDKQTFCKQLLENGYMMKATTRMVETIRLLEDKVKACEKRSDILHNEKMDKNEELNIMADMYKNILKLYVRTKVENNHLKLC